MSKNKIYSYWYKRERNLSERAYDTFNLLLEIKQIINVDEWQTTFDQIIRIDDKENSIRILLDHFKKEIRRHYKLKEVSDSFSEEKGSRIVLKSYQKEILLKLEFNIGSGNIKIPNCIILEGLNANDSTILSIFKIIINHFNVDWASIADFSFVNDIAKQSANEFFIGWVLYLSDIVMFDSDELDCHIQKLDHGKLIYVTEDQFNPENQWHINKALNVVQILRLNNITIDMLTKEKA
jgi:hypothetical protein